MTYTSFSLLKMMTIRQMPTTSEESTVRWNVQRRTGLSFIVTPPIIVPAARGANGKIQLTADGDLSMLTGDLDLHPGLPKLMTLTTVMIPGRRSRYADYLSFGYWVQATEKADGTTDYLVVTTFATGSMLGMSTGMPLLNPSRLAASYDRCGGWRMYVKKTLAP